MTTEYGRAPRAESFRSSSELEYERGFAAGERMAWDERKKPRLPVKPEGRLDPWHEGFWAARLPRSSVWSLRKPAIKSYAEVE
jgi:hypothetical protein